MAMPPGTLNRDQTYKLMTGAIVPRQIAWVTARSPDGVGNAAPSACVKAPRIADAHLR